jgi:RecA-family ATPase
MFPYTLRDAAIKLNGDVSGNEILCPGPGHSAKDRSLAVRIDAGAPDGFVVHSHAGDDPLGCKDYVRDKLGLPAFQPQAKTKGSGIGAHRFSIDALVRAAQSAASHKPNGAPTATYHYYDRDGTTLLYDVLRYDNPKRFAHRLPDGTFKGSDKRVLYRWHELLEFPEATVFITEGEKDSESIAALELTATTVASGKWTMNCINAIADRECWIVQDCDDAGKTKAQALAANLYGVARSVKVVHLPGLTGASGNKDVTDWLNQGHTKDELIAACTDTPDWHPTGKINGNDTGATLSAADGAAHTPEVLPPLPFVNINAWCDRAPPPREWAVLERFPLRNVSLLSGEGAIGKTIVLQQLAAASVLGRGWLDALPEPGPAIYLNAEDEEGELHRRFADIATNLYEVPLSELAKDLHLLAFAGKDAVLAHADRQGLVKPTPLFERITEAARDIRPKIIVLDTSADIFAGNENDRSQVRQFIGLLRGLSIAGNSGVIVALHPSLTGISSGTGLSGSTAWHNSVRARAYLHTIKVEDTEPDKTLRQLDFMKSNYSALADSVTLRWKAGVFVPDAKPGSLERMAADAKADTAFMALLDKFTRQGRNVSHKPTSNNFAPSEFSKEPGAPSKLALVDAMRRLFMAEKIVAETYGRSDRGASRIVAKTS